MFAKEEAVPAGNSSIAQSNLKLGVSQNISVLELFDDQQVLVSCYQIIGFSVLR